MPPMAMELKVDTDPQEVGFDAGRLERIDRHFAWYVEEGQLPGWLIVVTRRGNDMRLYLDGGLQFSTRDEYRYTESLVYPALGAGARSVLVLGGGDGLAAPAGTWSLI